MSKKTTTTNGLAQDMIKGVNGITLDNRTHNSQVSWYMQKQIDFVRENINRKIERKEMLESAQQDAIRDSKEKQEELDHGAMLQRERDIAWLTSQIEVGESYLAYHVQASHQLFPETHKKSVQNADMMEEILKKYA